jgi:hypothetical protein
MVQPENTKGGSITVLLTSCLTGLESAVGQLTIFVFIYKNRLIQTGQTGGQQYIVVPGTTFDSCFGDERFKSVVLFHTIVRADRIASWPIDQHQLNSLLKVQAWLLCPAGTMVQHLTPIPKVQSSKL